MPRVVCDIRQFGTATFGGTFADAAISPGVPMFRSMPSGRNPGAFAYIGNRAGRKTSASAERSGRGLSEQSGTICTPTELAPSGAATILPVRT
jgi:hypothetical protein